MTSIVYTILGVVAFLGLVFSIGFLPTSIPTEALSWLTQIVGVAYKFDKLIPIHEEVTFLLFATGVSLTLTIAELIFGSFQATKPNN